MNFTFKVCKKKFFNRTYLKNHSVMHNEVGNVPCPHCDKKFKRKTSLEYHICRDHTGQKPYSCPVTDCGYRAIDFANTRKHIKSVHKSNARPVRVSSVLLKLVK